MKGTRLKPALSPTPVRAEAPIEGDTRSRRANTEAAVRASSRISSNERDLEGRIAATMATTRPSREYLTRRNIISWVSKAKDILNDSNIFREKKGYKKYCSNLNII